MRSFTFPRDLLAGKSKRFQENEGTAIDIIEKTAHPEVLRSYLHLLSEGKMILPEDDEALKNGEKWTRMVKLYVLAYKLQDGESANLVTDECIQRLDSGASLPPCVIRDLYVNTNENTKLRRVIVDYFATVMKYDRSDQAKGKLAGRGLEAFILDVACAAVLRVTSCGVKARSMSIFDKTNYHQNF